MLPFWQEISMVRTRTENTDWTAETEHSCSVLLGQDTVGQTGKRRDGQERNSCQILEPSLVNTESRKYLIGSHNKTETFTRRNVTHKP